LYRALIASAFTSLLLIQLWICIYGRSRALA